MSATNDLFTITKIDHKDESVQAALSINTDSDILKGHFPGHPVVPGACMLQIIKEVLESALGGSFQLKKADHLKFMSLVDPTNISEVQLEIDYRLQDDNSIYITSKLSNEDTVCFKLQGVFAKV
jgi:3-hydroxyacyl-[acyl-carrier-protein] dehydratase